ICIFTPTPPVGTCSTALTRRGPGNRERKFGGFWRPTSNHPSDCRSELVLSCRPAKGARRRGLQLVTQEKKAVKGGGFTAQHEGSQTDRQGPGALYRRNLAGSEIAFGADPDRDRSGQPLVPGKKGVEAFAGMGAAVLEGREQRKFKRLLASEELIQ